MPHPRGQNHTIAGREVKIVGSTRCIALIRQYEADRTFDTIEYFLIAMAMDRVVVAWTVGPGIGRKSLLLHPLAQRLFLWRCCLLPVDNLHMLAPFCRVASTRLFSISHLCKDCVKMR